MKTIHRTLKNIGVLFAAEIIGNALFFILFIILSYRFTPAVLGGYVTLAAIIYFASSLTDLGISQVLVREIAKNRSNTSHLLSQGLTIVGGSIILVSSILIFIAKFGNYPDMLRPLIALTGLAVVGNCLMQVSFSVFRGYERMEIQALITSFLLLISSIVGIGLALAQFGLAAQLINLVTWPIAGAVTALSIVHRQFARLSLTLSWQGCYRLFLNALPIGLLFWCVVFLQWFGLLVLGHFRPMSDVAIYGTASKMFYAPVTFLGCGIAALIPVMSIYWNQSADKALAFYKKSLGPFIAVGFGGTTGLLLLADSLIPAIFGANYREAIAPLKVLAFTFALIALGAPVLVLLLSVDGLLKRFFPLLSFILFGNVFLNLILVPHFGYMGSAVTFLLTICIAFLVSLSIARACFGKMLFRWSLFTRPALASLIMALVLWKLRAASVFLSIPVGLAVFIIVLFILGELRQEPYRSLWTRQEIHTEN
jgi:O-antigen/teichoic acid export membrane protein